MSVGGNAQINEMNEEHYYKKLQNTEHNY